MKKIYSSLAALAIVASVSAQNASFSASKIKLKADDSVTALEQPSATPSVTATGDTINGYYYDFSTPSNWTFGNDGTPSADWEITTSGPTGDFSESYGPLESTTAANGWAMFDSDGVGSGSSVQNAWIQLANPVDLTGFASVAVTFQQFYRRFNDVVYLEVSTDGTAWTTYEVNTDLAANVSSDNPDSRLVNISGAAGGASTVWIRFRFEGGWDYFWQIDDVAFVEGAGDDLVLEKAYHGDVFADWEYAITPVAQTVSVNVGVLVKNNGGNEATNVVCNYEISLDGSQVDAGTFPVGDGTIESSATDTGWYDTGYIPSTVGVYTVTYEIASDATDESPADNEGTRVFETSQHEWSHELEDLWDGEYGGYIVPNSNPQEMLPYSHGSVFYPVADADLTGIKVSFGSFTSATSSEPIALTVEVHEIGQNIQDIVDSEIQLEDLEGTGWQTFILDNPYPLVEGVGYILAVSTPGEPDIMTIDGWGEDDDLAAANYGPFGEGGAENWYNGWDYSSAIRAVFDPALGVNDEDNNDVSSVRVYPNPASNNLTVRFKSNENQDVTINVVGSDGALVFAEQLSVTAGQNSNIDFDVNDLAAGLYLVQIQGPNSALTRRVVID